MIEALFLLLATAAPQIAADPLAAAKAGKIQCSAPNIEKKTCMGLTRYTIKPDGSFETTTTVLISPVVAMEVKSKGTVKNGALCSPILLSDFEASSFLMDGKPIDAATATSIRAQIVASLAPLANTTGCTRETPDGALSKAEVTLDGVVRPEMAQTVLWVRPEEGYKLGV